MSRAEGIYETNNQPMILMNCYDAILQADAREIFFLSHLNIMQYMDSSCIWPQEPKGKEN